MSLESPTFNNSQESQQARLDALNAHLEQVIIPEVSTWEIRTAKEFVDGAKALSESHDLSLGDAWKIVRTHAYVQLNFWQEHVLKKDLEAFQAAGYFEETM